MDGLPINPGEPRNVRMYLGPSIPGGSRKGADSNRPGSIGESKLTYIIILIRHTTFYQPRSTLLNHLGHVISRGLDAWIDEGDLFACAEEKFRWV